MIISNSIFLFIFLSIATAFYVFANFAHKEIKKPTVKKIGLLILSSIVLITLEYSFKLPGFYLFGLKSYNRLTLQMMWIVFTTIGVILFEKFYLKYKIPISSYIIILIVIILLITEANLRDNLK